jgi:hypothetical protein
MPDNMKQEKFVFHLNHQRVLILFMFIGAGALGLAFYKDQPRAWANFLLNNFYFFSIALSGLFFISVHYVCNASWGTGLRRVPEAMLAYLPVSVILMTVLFFGMPSLYHWSHPDFVLHDPILEAKKPYLNIPFFYIRWALFSLVWLFFAKKMRDYSLMQDRNGDPAMTQKNFRLGAVFLVVFSFTYSLTSYDWIMSLEPHWYSTIFSIYTFAGLFLHGMGVITLMVLFLRSQGYLREVVNENHLHDLGKLIFAFSTFWAYIWFFQYMLIWYANLPEETIYYQMRHQNGWMALFILNLILNWIVPFFVLLPRGAKRNEKVLWGISLSLLIAHWLDLYLMVIPGTLTKITLGPTEILTSLGFLSLFFFVVLRALARAPLAPYRDPYFEESIRLKQ